MHSCNLCNADIGKDERIHCSIVFEGHSEYGTVQEYGPLILSYCVDCNQQANLTQKLCDAFSILSELIQFECKKPYLSAGKTDFKESQEFAARFEI